MTNITEILPIDKDQKYNIYLDDCRDTPYGFHIRTLTYESTIQALEELEGHIGLLSLDNDLGEGLREGNEVMDWIEEKYNLNNYKLPDKIVVHSMNPIAKCKMEQIIAKLYGDKNE